MADRTLELTGQLKILKLAESGHNICVVGKAGVGKSTAVLELTKRLSAKGKKCFIVCASGVACDPYNGAAKTVHSQYGLQTCELPKQLLVERALKRNNIVDFITDTDVLVWDEISMSSKRIFELVNMLHHIVSKNALPFGGIQVILVGDFCQLKPIPDILDKGNPVFHSKLFNKAFPHRIELSEVKRQHHFEIRLKNALDRLRSGDCDESTEAYFKTLDRELKCDGHNEGDVVHLYFKKLPVEVHNLNVLQSLPGNFLVLESSDTGCGQHLERNVRHILTLKRNCKVMLLYNINSQLRNGLQGTFIDISEDNDELFVDFPIVGTVRISRRTWYEFDKNGCVKASRTQFPVTPCYATTVHKAQSLNMNAVVVHCSPEFVSGQTYVALSRVREEAALKVIGFQRKFLLPIPAEVLSLANDTCDPDPTLDCCRKIQLDECFFDCHDECMNDDEGDEDGNDTMYDDEAAKTFFETNAGVPINLKDVLASLCDCEEKLAAPSPDFSIKDFLQKIIDDSNDDPFGTSMKSAAKYGLDNLAVFELLPKILWYRINGIFEDYLSENGEEVYMTNKDFTAATGNLHGLFLTQEYRSDLISSFNVPCWSDINDGQRALGFELVFSLFKLFSLELANLVRGKVQEEPIRFEVNEMGPEGRGKIRYIGGWALRKSLQKSRRYIIIIYIYTYVSTETFYCTFFLYFPEFLS